MSAAGGGGSVAGWDVRPPAALAAWRRGFDAGNEHVHAFLPEPARWRRLAAAVAAAGDEDGPLAGVPVGVKDIFHVEDLPTRAGSRLPVAALRGTEAESVRRLRAAGALVAGKTVTTEFAYFDPGPTRNPRAPGRTPGGSSSGSAAAVAAGLCPLALGTQTIGSICRPAAYCGVVGFKPSYERVPRAGVIPLAPSVDHVGVLAEDVGWARRAAAVLCDGWRDGEAPATRPALGVPVGPYLDAAEPAGREHLDEVVRRLGAAGLEVRPVPALADHGAVVERHRLLVAAEAAEVHRRWYDRHGPLYRPRTAELIERGREVTAEELAAARAGRETLRRQLEARMDEEGLDLWLSPAAPGPAPLGLGGTGSPLMNLPWTHAGLPTVAVPAGATPDGLPLGVQLTARFGADEALLAWAEGIAAALGAPGG